MYYCQEFGVFVVGSGGGALTAANRAHDLGFTVLVIEKTNLYGGTTARSGGGCWIPNNEDILQKDSPDAALTFLKSCTEGRVPESKLRAYIENAVKTVAYLRDHVGVRFLTHPTYPDYMPGPGALPGGRTMFPETFDRNALGSELARLRLDGATVFFGRYSVPAHVSVAMLRRAPGWMLKFARQVMRYWLDIPQRLRSKDDRALNNGVALIAGLRKGLIDRDVPLALETPLLDLLAENGRVVGAVVRHKGREITIKTRNGVILGAGGFEQSQELRERHLPKPTNRAWSLTPEGANTGDALRAAMAIGAATEFLDLVWWAPTMKITLPDTGAETSVTLMIDRAFPGSITVNQLGKRFANESLSYNDFGCAMLQDNEKTGGASLPAWMIFDTAFRRIHPSGAMLPASVMPDHKLPRDWLGKVYYRAQTLRELAQQIGIDAQVLEETVDRFNGFAATGVDEDFQRGSNAYDHFFGDENVKPNPSLGPLKTPPYYAIPMNLGDIGTKGGLKTDEFAVVLDQNGDPIEGLYAIGNTSAAVTAASYPGAGATLGPAITFGFIAANHLSSVRRLQDVTPAAELMQAQ